MTYMGWLQIAIFAIILLVLTRPLGAYMYRVLEGERVFLSPVFRPVERLSYRLIGVDPMLNMRWTQYASALLAFSCVSLLLSYAVLRFQGFLPLNPMQFSTSGAPSYSTPMTPDLAFNTAVSFVTNTNWQSYGGESTMSYLSQMLGLAFQNWISAASGIAVAAALIRGFARRNTEGIGNFWADLTRVCLYILLPICFVLSMIFVWQGVPQNFAAYSSVRTVEGESQIIPQGPIASQESIKMVGTNGGGLFNANSAHPYENPSPLTNLLQMLAIFVIGVALTYTFGKSLNDTRQGWALLAAMAIVWLVGTTVCYQSEMVGNPNIIRLGIEASSAALKDSGGNMEGKELRFGQAQSALFTTVTTDASCGAVNTMHDSLTPLGGLIPLINIQLGEVIVGGVGSGLYGILVYAIQTVFIAGLMVGRTPEYVGKKIEKKEVKMAMLFVLAGALSILVLTAVAAATSLPLKSALNPSGALWDNVNNGGPHGFSELLYAFSSATGNNGSAFAGLSANTPAYNILLSLAMFAGRFLMIIPVLAMAGSLAAKKFVPTSSGTFPTHSWLFVVLLIGVIVIVGALTFFPALTLGPIVEHYLMWQGRLF